MSGQMDRTKLRYAKLDLYHQLLSMPDGEWTESDLDIGFALAKDTDIQAHLQQQLDRERAMWPRVSP